MRKVCLFNFVEIADFHGYQIESFDPFSYFSRGDHWSLSDLIMWGVNGYDHRRAIAAGVAGVDRLYRERDPNYMRMASEFIERFRDFDLIVMSTNNFIHPELIARSLQKPTKILGFIDDPISTYVRGIPYLWAFDGAFFISPGYIDNQPFQDAVRRWCSKPCTWWPLVPFPMPRPAEPAEDFFRRRDVDLVYVGNPCASKIERLRRLRKHFGPRMRIHGRWPFRGYHGLLRGLLGKPVFPYRVTPVTADERTRLYWRARIGFNMHVSEMPFETGNMRMYEIPAHGAMMVCDKASASAHSLIFESDTEAVYYDSIDEAIDMIEYYITNEKERVRIARAGFERFWKDYEWEANLLRLLDWASSIRTQD